MTTPRLTLLSDALAMAAIAAFYVVMVLLVLA